jgi:nucleoside-diphosphate-sugar epimerase
MARSGWDEVVLLTGFPSFLARKTCDALLAEKRRTLVRAVVRAKFLPDAKAALAALPREQAARVDLIEGDAASMDLGLSGAEVRALGAEVDVIHHCAHVSYPGVDRETAEHTNVGGALEVLEVARACPSLRCVVHYSTASVSGDRSGLVREEDLDRGQGFHNVVEETSAKAERVMRAAMPNVPVVVLRPSIVVGDSTTGEVDRMDGPYLLVLLMLTSPPDLAMPLPGRGDVLLNMVPVDFVVRAALAIARDARAVGRTFHLADPAPLTARRVFELVARAGGRRTPRGFIPANLTKALLRTPGIERFVRSPRAFIETLGTNVTYSTTNADELLEGTGVRCPPFEEYVDTIVEYASQRLKGRRDAKERDDMPDPLG